MYLVFIGVALSFLLSLFQWLESLENSEAALCRVDFHCPQNSFLHWPGKHEAAQGFSRHPRLSAVLETPGHGGVVFLQGPF